MYRFRTRGHKVGVCNICGDYGELSEDHTPPKGAVRITQVEINRLSETLGVDKPVKGRISQNGVKFRTLCKICNNTHLGSNYDVEFNYFSAEIKKYLNSSIELPKVMYVKSKPAKIARALYGHLSAIGVDRYHENEKTLVLKEWFRDASLAIPNFINIYYWLYPYQRQVLVRDAGMRDLRLKDPAVFWMMKFFPVSFLITWNNPEGYTFPTLGNFNRWKNMSGDQETEIPIDLVQIPHELWPETPDDNRFILIGDGAIGAQEKKRQK